MQATHRIWIGRFQHIFFLLPTDWFGVAVDLDEEGKPSGELLPWIKSVCPFSPNSRRPVNQQMQWERTLADQLRREMRGCCVKL